MTGKVIDFYTGLETSESQIEQENEFFVGALQEVISGLATGDAESLRKIGYDSLTPQQRMLINSIKAAKKHGVKK